MLCKFFKIIFQKDINAGKLRLPPAFVTEHGRSLSKTAVVEIPNGVAKEVDVEKRGREMYLCGQAWCELLQCNNVEAGFFMSFGFYGNQNGRSCFLVDIFSTSATEISYPQQNEIILVDEEEEEERVSIRKRRTSTKIPRSTSASSSKQRVKRKIRVPSDKFTKVRKSVKCKNPFFVVEVQPSYIQGGYLYVPTSFFDDHLKCEEVNVILQNLNGKTWEVKMLPKPKTRLVGSGWRKFKCGNDVKEGHVCVFEMIKKKPITFVVRIH